MPIVTPDVDRLQVTWIVVRLDVIVVMNDDLIHKNIHLTDVASVRAHTIVSEENLTIRELPLTAG
jgi:hypothetical protein